VDRAGVVIPELLQGAPESLGQGTFPPQLLLAKHWRRREPLHQGGQETSVSHVDDTPAAHPRVRGPCWGLRGGHRGPPGLRGLLPLLLSCCTKPMPELQLVRPGWWLQGFGTIDAGMQRRRHGGEGGGETSRHASAIILVINQKKGLLASRAAQLHSTRTFPATLRRSASPYLRPAVCAGCDDGVAVVILWGVQSSGQCHPPRRVQP
jgi:hypothetical protein